MMPSEITERHRLVTAAIVEAARREMRAVAAGLRDDDLRCAEVEAIQQRASDLLDRATQVSDGLLMLSRPREAMAHA